MRWSTPKAADQKASKQRWKRKSSKTFANAGTALERIEQTVDKRKPQLLGTRTSHSLGWSGNATCQRQGTCICAHQPLTSTAPTTRSLDEVAPSAVTTALSDLRQSSNFINCIQCIKWVPQVLVQSICVPILDPQPNASIASNASIACGRSGLHLKNARVSQAPQLAPSRRSRRPGHRGRFVRKWTFEPLATELVGSTKVTSSKNHPSSAGAKETNKCPKEKRCSG